MGDPGEKPELPWLASRKRATASGRGASVWARRRGEPSLAGAWRRSRPDLFGSGAVPVSPPAICRELACELSTESGEPSLAFCTRESWPWAESLLAAWTECGAA